jgi:antitoxin ParD1/3/4
MPTRNVVLTEQQAALVERFAASGRYKNASEVLGDGRPITTRRGEC